MNPLKTIPAQATADQLNVATGGPREEYDYSTSERMLIRTIREPEGMERTTRVVSPFASRNRSMREMYDLAWLKASQSPPSEAPEGGRPVRVVDLFSGCGGMTLGVNEACRALNRHFEAVLAADVDESALQIYKRNFEGAQTVAKPLETVLDAEIGARPSEPERALIDQIGRVDLVVGGPPCQGHSNLNNKTRRADPKNGLMLRMARFAELLEPSHLIIENVPAVIHDRGRVATATERALRELGYQTDMGIVDLARIGVPQLRRRFVLVASESPIDLNASIEGFRATERTVRWAIGDLQNLELDSVFDTPSALSATNARRIEYLFANALFDLPDEQRPPCHRDKEHSYKSAYGRLSWDRPSQTITTGFGSMGQGRFVHPSRQRTITPHEAARLQFFPDFFDFGDTRRGELSKLIGNAVPPKLTYVLTMALFHNMATEAAV